MRKVLLGFLALVFIVGSLQSADAQSRGALVYKNDAEQTIPTDIETLATFSEAVYDTDSFFNPSVPTRLTIPAGVSKVRLIAQNIWDHNDVGYRQIVIKKNYISTTDHPGWYPGNPAFTILPNIFTTSDLQISTPIIPVVEGDYFIVESRQTSGGDLLLRKSQGTWFAIEVVE